ncbi:MAG: hypothetical protein BWX84_00046 [Verrucomicrobia bacterium ADurb.Bin118]|nr:MAG: hypothetical protein BWX84_00046 [Verrucomicrobia bacterium ADurb.Bin118]
MDVGQQEQDAQVPTCYQPHLRILGESLIQYSYQPGELERLTGRLIMAKLSRAARTSVVPAIREEVARLIAPALEARPARHNMGAKKCVAC